MSKARHTCSVLGLLPPFRAVEWYRVYEEVGRPSVTSEIVPTVTVVIGLSLRPVDDTGSDNSPTEPAESVAVTGKVVDPAAVSPFSVIASGSNRYLPLDDWR